MVVVFVVGVVVGVVAHAHKDVIKAKVDEVLVKLHLK